MSEKDPLAGKAALTGTFYLLDPNTVLDLYEKAGKDPDSDEDSKQPDYVERIDGVSYLFTGWTVQRKGEEYEFVVRLGSDFTESEMESIDFMQPEDFEED